MIKIINYGRSKVVMSLQKDVVDQYLVTSNLCPRCGLKSELTPDHIVPQSLLEQFGIDCRNVWIPNNIQVLCLRCNQFKANRLDFTNHNTFAVLEALINYAKTGEGVIDKRIKDWPLKLNVLDQDEFNANRLNV